jgi:hypothetical protein
MMRGVVLSAGGGQHGSLGHGDAVTQLSVLTPIRALEGTHATDALILVSVAVNVIISQFC